MPKGKNTKEIKRWVTLPDGTSERRSFYGETREEAELKWRQTQTPALAVPNAFPQGTFAWWLVEKWKPLKDHLELSTRDNYQLAARHLVGELGLIPIKSIDATALTLALAKIARKHKKVVKKDEDGKVRAVETEGTLSASVVNRCRSIALEVIELASESDACRRINPRRVARRKDPKKKIVPYTPKEMRRLLEVCEGTISYAPVLFGCFLGLTINEARALKDSDLKRDGTLEVHHHMKRRGERSTKMKNEYRVRELPLPPGLLEEVKKLCKGGGWLCKNTLGTLVDEGLIDRSMYPKMERAGLRRLTFHQLRHSFSSWLEDNGCPGTIRRKLMGQSTEEVQYLYNHPTEIKKREWLGKLWDASLEPWEEGEEPVPHVPERGPRKAASGSSNGRAILSEDQVRLIRRRLVDGEEMAAIARDYGVDESTVRLIREGKTWKKVA